MQETINSIVEGCLPDTPMKVMYAGTEMQIPENARIILCEHELHPIQYLLYAKSSDFSDLEIINNPVFETNIKNQGRLYHGGWPILKSSPNFRWIFDAQRSIITKDRRIYVDTTYFEQDWRWYLNFVPIIFKHCGSIFSGEKTDADFNN
jgi:hypothetical protein